MKHLSTWSNPALRWALAPLALTASLISAYLLWLTLTEAPAAGCGGDSAIGCDEVLASRWSRWLGVPVALPAALVYLAICASALAASFPLPASLRRAAWVLLLGLVSLAAGAGLWMIGLQWFVIGKFCPFCLAVHGCGLALLIAALVFAPFRLKRARAERVAFRIQRGAMRAGVQPAERATSGGHEAAHADDLNPPLLSLQSAALAMTVGFAATLVLSAAHIAVQPQRATYTVETSADRAQRRAAQAAEQEQETIEPAGDPLDDENPISPASGADPFERDSAEASGADPLDPADEGPATSAGQDDPLQPSRASPESSQPRPTSSLDDIFGDLEDKPARLIHLVDGSVKINLVEAVVLGPEENEHLVAKVFDYTCPHCRVMHQQLEAAREHYQGKLTVVLVPVPLNAGCNPAIQATHERHAYACLYARLALAVWRHDRRAFEEFHNWLFKPTEPPDPGVARARVIELIGSAALDAALSGVEIDAQIAANVEIFRACNAGQIPKLIIDDNIVTGEVPSHDDFFKLLQLYFDLGQKEDAK